MTEIALSHWIGPFEELIPDEREIVARLVKTGGAIVGSVESIAARLHNAHFIALLRERRTERIIAVGALKNPSAIGSTSLKRQGFYCKDSVPHWSSDM